jgi:heat shock protein HtpX
MTTRSFFDEQAANRRTSVVLVLLVAVVLAALGATIGAAYGSALIGLAAGAVCLVIQLLFLFSMGDSLALLDAQAHQVTHSQEPQLHNVVEEMAIAAGIPTPKVYVMETPAMNAFATGLSPKKSAVAITRGLMEKLNRDELQGVIAHEISHIRNLDTRVMIVVAVMVGAIVMLSDLFLRFAFRMPRSRGRDGKGQMIIILVAIVLAILAPIFAMILQFAVSRKREYLADASAAELTRYPLGLASALKKLTGPANTPYKEAGKAYAHFYIVHPAKPMERSSSVFSTHPPIGERIKRLEEMAMLYRPQESPA